jgi:hypothetical protein
VTVLPASSPNLAVDQPAFCDDLAKLAVLIHTGTHTVQDPGLLMPM